MHIHDCNVRVPIHLPNIGDYFIRDVPSQAPMVNAFPKLYAFVALYLFSLTNLLLSVFYLSNLVRYSLYRIDSVE